jgi:hypothetical protein
LSRNQRTDLRAHFAAQARWREVRPGVVGRRGEVVTEDEDTDAEMQLPILSVERGSGE